MSFGDLVRFMRGELSRNDSVILDHNQLRAASRTPNLVLNRQSGNEIAGKLVDVFSVDEITNWKFSIETFMNTETGGLIFYLCAGRDMAALGQARRQLQQRVVREHDNARISPEIVIPHSHPRKK